MPLATPVKQKRKIHEGKFEILYKKEGGLQKQKNYAGVFFRLFPTLYP